MVYMGGFMKTQDQRALIICAHDDDEVIGPGGTIRKLTDSGVEVTTLLFATGNEGYQVLEQKDTIIERRKTERAVAQKILGTVHCITCDYPDFSNLENENVYRKIMQVVRQVRPCVVFSHLQTDYLAHRTLSKIVPEAIWQAGWQCSLELGEPWSVNRIFLFAILEFIARPSHIVDITDTFDKKLEAMKAYRSQHQVVSGILGQIEARALAYGSMAGVKYGEAFMRSQSVPIVVNLANDMTESMI